MSVRGSRSNLMGRLETTLDDQEEYIGQKVFKELESDYNYLDDKAKELEDELDDANDRIEELENRIKELEDDR